MARSYIQLRTWLSAVLPDRHDDRGASVVEYAMLLALIFVVLVISVNIIGAQTSNGLDDAANQGFVQTSPN